MELWIRSQNKCKLRKTDIINYSYEEGKHKIDCNGYPCGVYESKKRCLEILDEIQGLLRGDLHIFLTACDVPNEVYRDLVTRKNNAILCEPNIEYFQSNVMVYQMPEK